jgi:hypothetical protein
MPSVGGASRWRGAAGGHGDRVADRRVRVGRRAALRYPPRISSPSQRLRREQVAPRQWRLALAVPPVTPLAPEC